MRVKLAFFRKVSELSERLSVGSLDLSSSSDSEDEGEEHLHHASVEREEHLHHASVAGVLEETEEHDQEYTIYDHVPLRRESSQFSISGISMLKVFKLFGFFVLKVPPGQIGST
jgi:hypothetical protein